MLQANGHPPDLVEWDTSARCARYIRSIGRPFGRARHHRGRISLMSFRRLISVGVLAASAAVLPALPGQAAPSTGSCDGSYPTNRPVLTLTVSPTTVTAGQSVFAFGNLHKNQCAIKNAPIRIQAQRVVNGTPTGSFRFVKSTTTRSNGNYLANVVRVHNVVLRAFFPGGG